MNFLDTSSNALIGRILRQPLRLIPDNTAMPILQGRLRGKRWIAGAHTHGCWLGSYEREKQKRFESAVKEGDTVFDIGANAGFYSLLASVLVGANGHVYAFEPVPRNIHLLKEHLRLNAIANVTVIEAAVSDVDGEAHFDDSSGNAMGYLSQAGKLEVESVTIDTLVGQGRVLPPDCLKIDIEGGEFSALKGAQGALQNHRPKVFLSTHSRERHSDCCELLRTLGYELNTVVGESVEQTDELLAI